MRLLENPKYTLIFIILLGLLIRAISLNQSLWLDEATSALVVKNLSFIEIVTKFSPGDFHPPLYYLLLKLWSNLFGYSEIALRGMSITFGIASIYLIYLISMRLFNRKVGLISAAILATSGLHLYFSQEVRMYIVALFFVSASFYFIVKTNKQSRVGDWIGYAVSVALAGATHYLSLTMIPVYWLVIKKSKNKKFVMSHNILMIFYLFWFPTFYKQLKYGLNTQQNFPLWWKTLGPTNFKQILLIPIKFMIGRISFDSNLVYFVIVVLIAIVFGYILIRSLKNFRKTQYLWYWLLIPIIITSMLGLRVSVLSYFRLIFILPAFYILVAFGVNSFSKQKQKVLIVLVLIINIITSGAYLFNSRFHREDWKSLTSFIRNQSLNTQSIVLFPNNSQMEAYQYYDSEAKLSGPQGLSDGYQQVWLIRYVQEIFDPNDNLRENIEDMGYEKQEEYDFNGIVVFKYIK